MRRDAWRQAWWLWVVVTGLLLVILPHLAFIIVGQQDPQTAFLADGSNALTKEIVTAILLFLVAAAIGWIRWTHRLAAACLLVAGFLLGLQGYQMLFLATGPGDFWYLALLEELLGAGGVALVGAGLGRVLRWVMHLLVRHVTSTRA